MELTISIFKLGSGIGLFLFAMFLIEEALKNLSGRKFKLFLQQITKNRIGAVAGGAIVTGILQSSSMVSLMVLAFVGAGVFTMKNALAIILGANLGTILSSWLVATLGFNVNIEVAAYPSVFFGGMMLILFGKYRSVKYLSFFLLGFGLLFIGLAFMKTSMEDQVKLFDFAQYAKMNLSAFLLIGFLITSLVQSSSVTMALTLSALYAGAVSFPMAAAIVLGSETGTTIKIMLSAVGGNASKKRVVLGNIMFNIFITIFAFAFLKPLLILITDIFNISNPLIGLVTFSTLVNLIGIFIFLPLLHPFTKLLERFFKHSAAANAFIIHADINEPESALDLFRRETAYFIHNSILYNLSQFEIETDLFEDHPVFKNINDERNFSSKTEEEKYDFLKQLQGELQGFYLKLSSKLEDENDSELNQLISSARNAMYAVKCIKDIKSNISNLSSSSKDIKFNFFSHTKAETEGFYRKLNAIIMKPEKITSEIFENMYSGVLENYNNALQDFYKEAAQAPVEDIDMTIVINFNRELFTSNNAIITAVRDYLRAENEIKKP